MTQLKPKNIYIMLSYAYRVLTEKTYDEASAHEFDNIHNLFAEIIRLGVTSQIKRGLTREYEAKTEDISGIRGKVLIEKSLEGISGHSTKLTCSFDEYSLNNPMNQVLKTTMHLLISSNDVDKERKGRLWSLMKYFSDVDLLNPYLINWQTFRYHRNNATYKMLMNLCYLILSGMILSDEKGELKLAQYVDDQKISKLYETFILEYYKKHYGEDLKPASKDILCNYVDNESFNEGLDFLPMMKTDIALHCNGRTLIIDAKYYGKSMQKAPHSEREKYKASNWYQIQAYVNNFDKEEKGVVDGMLLYAKTDELMQNPVTYRIPRGNYFCIRTLDLSGEWEDIKKALNSIAERFIERSNVHSKPHEKKTKTTTKDNL